MNARSSRTKRADNQGDLLLLHIQRRMKLQRQSVKWMDKMSVTGQLWFKLPRHVNLVVVEVVVEVVPHMVVVGVEAVETTAVVAIREVVMVVVVVVVVVVVSSSVQSHVLGSTSGQCE